MFANLAIVVFGTLNPKFAADKITSAKFNLVQTILW